MSQRSAKRVALVTGASRGIGRAIALALAKAGASVGVGYHRNQSLAEDLAASLRGQGCEALALPIAVDERSSVQAACRFLGERLGPPTVLVNNAAMAQEKAFALISDADWEAILKTNLQGAFACCQEVLPAMEAAGWGRIVNITSIGGQIGGLRQVHYAAAKAGLISLTRSLARIYSARGITVNAIAPGLVATDMTAHELDSEAGREKVKAIPMGRIATGEEIAATAVFLASEAASYVTGQTINVNGGMYFG